MKVFHIFNLNKIVGFNNEYMHDLYSLSPVVVHTEPVVSTCVGCSRSFRTYVPDTICHLPGGGSVFYPSPQLKCPLCDETHFGAFMNGDLFPELGQAFSNVVFPQSAE